MNDVNKNLGHATAYGYAKSKGYTGTEDEFAALMADYAEVGERAEAAATAAAASATAASGSASDSAASATAAEGSAGTATTAAGNASQAAQTATTKASEAAQSATQAAGSATTASTKATEAAQSATAAAGSATTAGTAATNAQTAQTAAETAQTAAETAQEAAEDAAESVSASAAQIAQNTEDISSVKNALGACVITDTASGAIATFTDGSNGVPMESVTVQMEPIQDLHGQSSPYPGGGGKNLAQITLTDGTNHGLTFTTLTDGDGNKIGVSVSGTPSSNYSRIVASASLKANTEYILTGCPSGGTSGTYCLGLFSGSDLSGHIGNDTGSGYTYTPTEDTTVYVAIRYWTTAGNISKTFTPMIRLSSVSDATFSPYSNICPISGRSEVGVWREATYDTSADQALTIPLGQTVYGGTVDVVSGVMTVDRAMVDLGTLNYYYQSNNNRFTSRTQLENAKYPSDDNTPFNAVCSALTIVSANQTTGTGVTYGVAIGSTDSTLRIRYAGITDTAEFKTAMNGVQLCYELAQPVTVQLDPQTITSLLGTNNVWSDGGDVSVEYVADTKAYIAKVIAAALA